MSLELKTFPCTQCGACCRHVNLSELTKHLDRGDGICHHYDLDSKLCSIYERRPEICRIDTFYQKHLKEQFTWNEFVELNLIACKQLENLD
ncbi:MULTISPECIES: YkgJ family cysteine cluster protein [Acinetobacter]|uniref:YkgJ family cysteine cluster protein n=1 Tax=Acinetobacter TaxID=469 RepID=UPI000A34C495|nr:MULTISPECIES: YkgJ family cysteine cluster protein [Acinetobacter]MEB6679170.1 YkgJ family cysteine cluster protein [Acinetobacter lwoffii]OTG73130.1 zinc/iron-chelating domain-containing protein [Acinetobacter sp. ANC 4218]HAY5018302.1 YkgJ family cysteine cluster protein [Escherichia coli]HAY5568462.1 YkgJ family cysteine cluster protein [Escherichia coli]